MLFDNEHVPLQAILQSDLNTLECCLVGGDFNVDTKYRGLTLLHLACHIKKPEILRTILSYEPLVIEGLLLSFRKISQLFSYICQCSLNCQRTFFLQC